MGEIASKESTRTDAPPRYVVRYGAMRLLNEFTWKPVPPLPRQTQVICRTERGLEWGTVLCPATARTQQLLNNNNECGRIVRIASPEDEAQRDSLAEREKQAFENGRQRIREHRLNMQLVDVELLFGGERLIFYYISDDRVDFRELVKTLVKDHNTRIELRQIGLREEARLLADYGDCGQPVCCNTHLREMPPVSMKMVKLQKATLDPAKISGRCGRLKCCLRYEYETYEEYRQQLPAVGATVITRKGTGKVVAQEILARRIMVQYDNQPPVLTDLKEIVTVVSAGGNSSSA
ncbi:MAG: signal peptidase [Planctomycetaceae bacterium]|nr:MAG: signal peptidase [Planctomycetaceae bacterium]